MRPPGTNPLKLQCDILPSTSAFNFNFCRYTKSRDNDLIDAILRSVRQDGNVLVPIDPAGRVLELMLVLEERWAQKQLGRPVQVDPGSTPC